MLFNPLYRIWGFNKSFAITKYSKYCFLYLIIISLFNAGCRKFVELGPPDTLLVTENVFQSDATANAAMLGIYAQISDRLEQNITYLLPVLTGLSGDELETNSDIYKSAYENALSPIDAPTNDVWTEIYNWIFQANLVYEGCSKSTGLNPGVKKQLMAEALFVRAYWYLYLVNLWGDVPYTTSSDYTNNSHLAKTPANEVYQKIIDDLKYAQNNLNENYVDANSIATTLDRARPNKAAATALLARVYLYTKDYINAEQQASILIDDKENFDTVALNDVFLKNSKEAIWQLVKSRISPLGIVTWEGYGFILNSVPLNGQYIINCNFISKILLDAFDNADQRKINWIGKFTDTQETPNKDYFFPYKYKIQRGTIPSEAPTILRLAEQYLIRSEARAQLNKLPEAIADVDVVRNRAGIEMIASANPVISKEDLLSVILTERQRELFTEWGHRWIDLKRTENINSVMSIVSSYKNAPWSSYKQFWPIAQKELNKNINIKQTPGY
jgi:starch-binding outer membrane protein, SusD/RagB family